MTNVAELLTAGEESILTADPNGPEWQRGSVLAPFIEFNPETQEFEGIARATAGSTPGVPDDYCSRIAIIDFGKNQNGIDGLSLRPEPLPEGRKISKEEQSKRLGREDAAFFTLPDGRKAVFWNDARFEPGRDDPYVGIGAGIASPDFTTFEHIGMILESPDPAYTRLKALTLDKRPLPNGNWPYWFGVGTERPGGAIVRDESCTIQELLGLDGVERRIITPAEVACMSLTQENIYIAAQGGNYRGVEPGPQVVEAEFEGATLPLQFYCGADMSPVQSWSIGVALLDPETRRPTHNLPRIMDPSGIPAFGQKKIVKRVAFPKSAVCLDDEIRVYFSGNDSYCGVALGSVKKLMPELLKEENQYTLPLPDHHNDDKSVAHALRMADIFGLKEFYNQ